jgi:hypothetical protein
VGRAEPGDHKKNPALGALTRAVGVYPNVQVDTLDIDLLPRDLYLLCSDGLHGYLEDFDLPTFINHTEPASIAAELVEYANKRGGMDNITAITVGVSRDSETAQTMRVRLTLKTLRSVSLFQHLSYSEQLRMISICEPMEVDSGFVAVQEGEHGDAMWIIAEGSVVVAPNWRSWGRALTSARWRWWTTVRVRHRCLRPNVHCSYGWGVPSSLRPCGPTRCWP